MPVAEVSYVQMICIQTVQIRRAGLIKLPTNNVTLSFSNHCLIKKRPILGAIQMCIPDVFEPRHAERTCNCSSDFEALYRTHVSAVNTEVKIHHVRRLKRGGCLTQACQDLSPKPWKNGLLAGEGCPDPSPPFPDPRKKQRKSFIS